MGSVVSRATATLSGTGATPPRLLPGAGRWRRCCGPVGSSSAACATCRPGVQVPDRSSPCLPVTLLLFVLVLRRPLGELPDDGDQHFPRVRVSTLLGLRYTVV